MGEKMKKFLVLLSILCFGAYADTINLHWLNEDGTTYQNSTCTVDSDLNIPTTPPTKYGYTFTGWEMVNYTPIEYLEGTGTQWFDTGYKPNSNTRIEYDLMISKADNDIGDEHTSFEMGSRVAYHNKVFCSMFYTNNTFRFLYGSNDFSNRDISINTKHSIIMYSSGRCYVDGILQYNYNQENIDNNFNIYVFKFNNGGTPAGGGHGKLYYFKIYDNDVLIRDFIPVLDMSGTPCMFDKVEAKFYYNQGTGQFIAGPALTE